MNFLAKSMIANVRVGEPGPKQAKAGLIIPIALPELSDIRKLAILLHERRLPYEDKVWGWPVSYTPSSSEPPIDSQMTFTPAGFFIGVWPIWYVSLLWENGDAAAPNLSIGDDELIKEDIGL